MKNVKKILKYFLVFAIGLIIGSVVIYFIKPNTEKVKATVVTNKADKDLFSPLYETYEVIKNEYYKDVNDEDLINGAIDGLLKSLGDKHTMFFDKESKKAFETELSGTYYGIGAEIKEISEEDVMIVRVFDNSPAEKVGLQSGDIIESIDGNSAKGMSATDISKTLRSETKSESTVVVSRDGEELSFNIKKDNVSMLSVASVMLDNNIGYIEVAIFGENTYSEFVKALNELEKDGMKNLIIDLRGNGGGYLSIVTQMLSEFVDRNTVIYQMSTKSGKEKFNSLNNNTKDYKVIILVDGDSASASEIMASAMQEQYGAILVGTKTYGKGTVQVMKDLSNDTLIKYTIQEWFTSKGNSINDVGITPNYEIELSEEFKNSPTRENDNQLQKAIELAR